MTTSHQNSFNVPRHGLYTSVKQWVTGWVKGTPPKLSPKSTMNLKTMKTYDLHYFHYHTHHTIVPVNQITMKRIEMFTVTEVISLNNMVLTLFSEGTSGHKACQYNRATSISVNLSPAWMSNSWRCMMFFCFQLISLGADSGVRWCHAWMMNAVTC